MTIGDILIDPDDNHYRVCRVVSAEIAYAYRLPDTGRYGNEWRRAAPKEVRVHPAWRIEEVTG